MENRGEAIFNKIIVRNPLTVKEKVAKIRLHEEFGYHDDTYIYVDVIGESGRNMWTSDGLIEDMHPLALYLSSMFSCPLETKLMFAKVDLSHTHLSADAPFHTAADFVAR